MATKKGKYDWTQDWTLHDPEDWVMLVVALLGIANLMPNISIPQFNFAWPVIIIVIFLYRLGKRKRPA